MRNVTGDFFMVVAIPFFVVGFLGLLVITTSSPADNSQETSEEGQEKVAIATLGGILIGGSLAAAGRAVKGDQCE